MPLILWSHSAFGQNDLINSGDVSSITEFRADLNARLPFGKTFKKSANEDNEAFVNRILKDNATLHHGAFQLEEFGNSIISFATYTYEESDLIIGVLLEPTPIKGEYRLIETMELLSGCGSRPEIISVFLHDADANKIGRELIIHASDYCGRHGRYNNVYVYNGLIKNNKLVLTKLLSERCDYSEVKLNGEWDFDMGEEDVEDRRYIKCKYLDYKAIRNELNAVRN
ncbi:hypothetical protein [Marinigracilibium pacificum]|uniref:Uncharacterized protein n=1 Tax=Marinigracilibium pacificum TaxID=2729599 RepID=A0A848ITE2_9BACT|nr:hypothetical protein [Marinigracilibium pacificum]NMM47617.1 hypothetical protein [Marinigracilibium pacificum]